MPSEPTTTDLDWTRLQGTVLEGGYQLETILAAKQDEASFKVRVLGDSAANAFANVFVAPAEVAQEQAATWERTREAKSKHLATPYGAGLTQVEGATLAYVVARRPDETLDAVLRERPLSSDEAGDVLLAMIGALEVLHANGLVHGCLSPEHILAIGDSIQLSTECVRSEGTQPSLDLPRPRYVAPESAGANVTPAADVWCMGATLIEILTQQRCGENCLEQAAALPQPFDNIARRCLDPDPEVRIKVGQAEAAFRGRRTPEAPVKQEASVKKAALASAGAAPVSPAALPKRAPVTVRAREAPEPNLRAWWIYAAAGIVVVLALIWLLKPKHAAVSANKQVASQTAAPASAWESKTITPDDAKTVSRPQPSVSAAPAPATHSPDLAKGQVWRVVLYTYTRQADADNKAHWVNTKYPGLGAEAFSPNGASPYLVVAGGQMSRDDATRLRQKVRSLGLPRDSYIQNFQR